jgi:hypothetical protein
MDRTPASPGSLLCNGAFHPALWTRLNSAAAVPCPVTAQTFAADRWHVRYAAPEGGVVAQVRSAEMPPGCSVGSSLEIQGGEGVAQPLCVGQNVEADEGLPHELRLRAWCHMEHPHLRSCPVRLAIGSPIQRDLFDRSVECVAQREMSLMTNVWTRLDFTFDATALRPCGLRVELELPPGLLNHPAARVRLADASLCLPSALEPTRRSLADEAALAGRFFQRHDARLLNAIGRALVCNAHELHFQFTFPLMRAFPSVSLPQDNADFSVHSLDGLEQSGFAYDVPFRARGSAIIRATKRNHQLRDGYLAFRGYRGAILLDSEL